MPAPRLRDLVEVRIQQPPPSEDQRQAQWQRDVADTLNQLPNLSIFSFTTPESNVTAQAPTLGFNLGTNVASNISAVWAKQLGSGTTGWVAIA